MTHLHYLKGFCHNDDSSCDKELKMLERVFLQSCVENITNPFYTIWSNKHNSPDFCQPQIAYPEWLINIILIYDFFGISPSTFLFALLSLSIWNAYLDGAMFWQLTTEKCCMKGNNLRVTICESIKWPKLMK